MWRSRSPSERRALLRTIPGPGEDGRNRRLPGWGKPFVALLALYAIAVIAPDTLRIIDGVEQVPGLGAWYPLGTLGFEADNDGAVTAVDRMGPAWQACIRPGDVIDLRAPTTDRRAVNQFVFVASGHPHTVHIGRRGEAGRLDCGETGAGDVRLMPEEERLSFADRAALLLAQLSGFLFIALCTYLVWQHATPETVGLFLYSVWFNSGQYFVWYANLPDRWLGWFDSAQALFQALGLTGILLFALYFPRDAVDGWRRVATRLLFVPAAVLLTFSMWAFRNFTHGEPTETAYHVYYGLTWAVYAAMFAFFWDTYRTRVAERPRIRWVILGAVWALLCFLIADTYEATSMFDWLERDFGLTLPQWTLNLLYAQSVWLPASVFYAVRYHRVIKVRFAITRALVFTLFVTALAGIVKLAELGVERMLMHRFHWLEELQTFLVVGLGLVGAWADRRGHRAVEAVIFSQWHHAEQRLKADADQLVDAEDLAVEDVDAAIVDEPVAALGLSFAAVFRPTDAGNFERERGAGEAPPPAKLDAHDPRVTAAMETPVSFHAPNWAAHEGTTDFSTPALAVPIIVHHRAIKLVFYGPHATGEDLDRDEIAVLHELGRAAAVAYARLEAEALRREVEELKARLTTKATDAAPPRSRDASDERPPESRAG